MLTETEIELPGRSSTHDIIRVDRALAIDGWMMPVEILWLAYQATKHSRIVELGSYLGRSTRALADNTPGWVLAVDDFLGPRDAINAEHNTLDRFKQNMKGTNVIICAEDFDAIDPSLHAPYDMIFIDGGHDYDSIRRDIDKWSPHLAKGGLLCGHDYEDNYRGVQKAVMESFTYHTHVVPYTSIWYVA